MQQEVSAVADWAHIGLRGVFIDLQQGFNPQYWPKLLAKGC